MASSGTYSLWLLSTYTLDPATKKISGTNQTCGFQNPDISLNMTGASAEGAPNGTMAKVQNRWPASSFVGVPTTPIDGLVGGIHVGATFETTPFVTVNGLLPSDPLWDAATPWPKKAADLTQADLAYSDGTPYVAGPPPVGHPGLHGTFTGTAPYYLSTTSLTAGGPLADQLWIVGRTKIALSGSRVSCTETKGTANVPLIQSRVVGCEIANDGGRCNDIQYGFIDANNTNYNLPATGTFDSIEIPSTDAAPASCKDVFTAFPAPM